MVMRGNMEWPITCCQSVRANIAAATNRKSGSVKSTIAVHITNVADRGANPLLKVNLRVAGNFTGQHDEISLGQRLAGDAAQGILLETRIENGIADGVADFIRMTFGDGFGRKNVTARHD